MFSKNAYLQFNPQLSPPRSAVDLNGVEILLHHGHPQMFSGHFLATTNAPPLLGSTLLNQDGRRGMNNNEDPNCGISSNMFQRKQTGKKDRHSKIFTSQGPRDRRVRLSIGIARKFFDLQEMLGFDKPSKTLDWLLTKSKAAIKDLVQTKQNSGKSTSSPSECEVLSSADNGNYLAGGDYSKKKFPNNKFKGAAKDPQQAAASNLAKESRAKARARARERTREKMCIKQMNGDCNINSSGSDLKPYNGNQTDQGLQFLGFHQPNAMVSRDLSSNYIIPSANNPTSENWDVSSFTSQSNLSAIFDHHKFN